MSPEIHRLPPKQREALLAQLAADLGVEELTLATCEPISVAELREMVEGVIFVGSHGRSHDSSLHLSREDLFAELTESKQVLESVTGRSVTWLAYPYGEFSQASIETAIGAGYRGAVTTIEGLNDTSPHPFALRRIGVDDNMSLAHFIVAVSGLRDLLKTLLRIGGGPPGRVSPRAGGGGGGASQGGGRGGKPALAATPGPEGGSPQFGG